MAIPPIQKQLIEKLMKNYCDSKIPKDLKDKIRLSYKIRANNITLIESRPFYRDNSMWIDMKVAQIRFENDKKLFTLFYVDRNEKWNLYDFIEPLKELEGILEEIDEDPTGIFWG